jgi:hypothetical protein
MVLWPMDHRHRRRLERSLVGPIQDESPAGAGKQAEDNGVLAENVVLKDFGRIAVKLEHADIERQHVLRCGFSGTRGDVPGNRLHIGRQILRHRRTDCSHKGNAGYRQTSKVLQKQILAHGAPPEHQCIWTRKY